MISLIWHTISLFMDENVMDSIEDIKSSNPYVYWIHLWELYGDPDVPPFLEDILPPVVAASSSDEITPPAPVAPTNPVPAIDASDSV